MRGSLQVGRVEQRPVAELVEAPGAIEAAPEKLVRITPPLTGRIVRLHRALGDAVKAGEPLATIDSPDLGTAYGDYNKSQATLRQAQQEYERQKALHDADIAAGRDFELAQLAMSEARSDARAAGNRLAQLGVNAASGSHREYVLRAPMAGRVVDVSGAQGAYWNDITASIMTVADLSSVWAAASVAEKDIGRMFVGQQATVILDAYPERQFKAQVKYIGDLLDTDTRTIRVRVAIDNPQGQLRPGMFARVIFQGASRSTLLVPAAALLQEGLYTRVYVERAPFRYESRIVTVGMTVGDRTEVLAGLEAGERIVVGNAVLLND